MQGGEQVMEVLCSECGNTIAVLIADTSRKQITKKKDAVCYNCYESEKEENN